jgi:hypothetical protein
MFQKEANRHYGRLSMHLASHLPNVVADRVQLQQALTNLMVNGIGAMRVTTDELSLKSQLAEDGQVLIPVATSALGWPLERSTTSLSVLYDQIAKHWSGTRDHSFHCRVAWWPDLRPMRTLDQVQRFSSRWLSRREAADHPTNSPIVLIVGDDAPRVRQCRA